METTILGLDWDNGKENANYMKLLYRDYVGIMEKKMETTISGVYWDNGKENGSYYNGVIHHQKLSFVAFAYCHVAEQAEYRKVRSHWPG